VANHKGAIELMWFPHFDVRHMIVEHSIKLSRLAIATLISGCTMMTTTQAQDASKPLRIVSFGTSLTNQGGWQVPLQTSLASCLNKSVEVLKVAQSGGTSDWAVSHVDDVVRLAPDIVLIEFYANDAAINRLMTRDRSRTNIALVFDRLKKKLPQTRVIMTRMNPVSGMRGSMRPLLEWYIDMQRNEALARGYEYVDYYPGWSQMTKKELESAIPDGLHPRPEAVARIVTSIMSPYLCKGNG
jgi:lysophospholipase L1-like esterase